MKSYRPVNDRTLADVNQANARLYGEESNPLRSGETQPARDAASCVMCGDPTELTCRKCGKVICRRCNSTHLAQSPECAMTVTTKDASFEPDYKVTSTCSADVDNRYDMELKPGTELEWYGSDSQGSVYQLKDGRKVKVSRQDDHCIRRMA